MTRKNLIGALVASLVLVALIVGAYQLGKGRSGAAREPDTTADGELRASVAAIEERLEQLEEEIESLHGVPPAGAPAGTTEPASDAAPGAAVESRLAALELQVKGIEQDPLQRAYSFLGSENAEMRRLGINTLARIARFDPKSREAIRGLLHDPSPRVREQAAQMLRNLRDKESAPEMKALLADSDPATRRRAVQALGLMDAREAARDIGNNLIADADDRVRIAAADALGRLRSPEAEEFLTQALRDRNDEVRGAAIASLGAIGATAAAPQLRAMYEQDPGSHRVRLALALKSLGDDGPLQKEVARLTEIVNSDADARTKQQAQRELGILTRK